MKNEVAFGNCCFSCGKKNIIILYILIIICEIFQSASALPPRNYVSPKDSSSSDSKSNQKMNWESLTEKKANTEYDNAARKLFQAYNNIEQKMMQIEGLARNFIKASRNYVKNQHDVNTKTYVRALETLESHKKAADMLAMKIKETSDKLAQYGAITTTLKPCSNTLPIDQNSTPTAILATASNVDIMKKDLVSTTPILETASVPTTAIELSKTSDVVTSLPIAIETSTVNTNDIFADSLKNLNLNYNNVLKNIGDQAVATNEVNIVVPPVAVML